MKLLITIPAAVPRFKVAYDVYIDQYTLLKITDTHVRFTEREPFGCRSIKVENGWIAVQETGNSLATIPATEVDALRKALGGENE